MLFKQFPNQNSCTTMLTLLELEVCTIASKDFVLQLWTVECAVRPIWLTLPSGEQWNSLLKEGTVITPFTLCTGADVGEVILEFSTRMFPARVVTVNETD